VRFSAVASGAGPLAVIALLFLSGNQGLGGLPGRYQVRRSSSFVAGPAALHAQVIGLLADGR
jgi:hypothetical protein